MVTDRETEQGAPVDARLRDELVAWLVTVSPDGTPVPTPVWFWWDGATTLVYSQREKPKLRHISSTSRIALALRTDRQGIELAVIAGEASTDDAAPPVDQHPEYPEKYRTEITRIGSGPTAFAAEYSVPIRIRRTKLRAP